MSRAAVFDTITSDAGLNALGITPSTVFHNWSKEERPTNSSAFVILLWGDEAAPLWGDLSARGARGLTVWVHYPQELSNDFNKVTAVLDRIDEVLSDARDVAGEDGYTLSFVNPTGRSGDLVDDGFLTITRTGNYDIYSVKS